MATKISRATGDFTAAGTWGVVDANGYIDSEASTTVISTTELTTPNFTPGVITTDGVLLKLNARAASPSGTFTVTLRNTFMSMDITSTTINVSDLVATGTGWLFIKWSSPQVTMGAATHAIKVVCSATGSQVTLYRSATTDDFSKMICTTTTGAPAASDQLIVVGEYTGAGTSNSFTVTMDNTATTVWGATSFVDAVAVGSKGTLQCGVAASTAYVFKYSGKFTVSSGGTLNLGTSGTRIPSTSSMTLDMDIASNVDTGLVIQNGGTFNAYGQTITAYQTLLTTDEAAAATVLGVASTAGWANGDEIAIASTTRTSTQHEKRTISTVDSATQVTVTSGLTNAHSGTSPTQAEVIHLTRNVKIKGESASLQGYVWFDDTSTVVCDSVQFKWLGSATTNKRGVDIQTTTGSCTITGCSFHEFSVSTSIGLNLSGSGHDNITISNSVLWSISSNGILVAVTTGAGDSISNVTIIGASAGLRVLDIGVSLSGIVVASDLGTGIFISESTAIASASYTNLTSHSNASDGISLGAMFGATFTNLKVWRTTGTGMFSSDSGFINNLIDTVELFGNTTRNLLISAACYDNVFRNVTSSGDTTFSTTSGFEGGAVGSRTIIENSTFGVVSGIKTAHTQDVLVTQSNHLVLRNCLLASSTEITNNAPQMSTPTYGIFSERHDQTAGLHKRVHRQGSAIIDTTTFNTASPSEKLSPINTSHPLPSTTMRCAVANGATVTVSVYVRKDTGSITATLRQLANPAVGINAIVVLDTMTVGSGTWEQLTGTTAAASDDGVFSFEVQCVGNSGALFVDDWSVS